MTDPEASRRALVPAALLTGLNTILMLAAPHVDHAPMTGPTFELLRWGCVLTHTLLLGTLLTVLKHPDLKGAGVQALWPLSLTGVLPTLALYLIGQVT